LNGRNIPHPETPVPGDGSRAFDSDGAHGPVGSSPLDLPRDERPVGPNIRPVSGDSHFLEPTPIVWEDDDEHFSDPRLQAFDEQGPLSGLDDPSFWNIP
jgi:hypothetical protein